MEDLDSYADFLAQLVEMGQITQAERTRRVDARFPRVERWQRPTQLTRLAFWELCDRAGIESQQDFMHQRWRLYYQGQAMFISQQILETTDDYSGLWEMVRRDFRVPDPVTVTVHQGRGIFTRQMMNEAAYNTRYWTDAINPPREEE